MGLSLFFAEATLHYLKAMGDDITLFLAPDAITPYTPIIIIVCFLLRTCTTDSGYMVMTVKVLTGSKLHVLSWGKCTLEAAKL